MGLRNTGGNAASLLLTIITITITIISTTLTIITITITIIGTTNSNTNNSNSLPSISEHADCLVFVLTFEPSLVSSCFIQSSFGLVCV